MGRLTEAKNNNSTVQRSYDTLSRPISETQGPNPIGAYGKTISYTYEDDGSRGTCEYFSGYDLTYTSDALGRWSKIEDVSSSDLVTQSFYGAGFRSYQVDYLNGTQTTIGYDGFRMPTDIDHADSGSTVFSGFDYAFDKVGNPLYVEFTHDSGKGNLYAYDKAYRLTSAQMGSNDPSAEAADSDWADYAYVKKIDYNMDDDSNRSSVVETPYGQSAATTSYSSDNLNQYTAIASVTQTHDDNGNLTDDGTLDYAYDYRSNLIEVISGVVTLSECEFDALGRRTKQVNGMATTKYFYDGEHVIEEYDGSDNLLRKFVYGQRIDEIRVMIAPDYGDVDDDQDSSEVLHFCYHTDMLGTVTHVTDENENVVESYEYTPYGQTTIKDGAGSIISSSAIWNPYMFTARRLDEGTGLYHYRRRAYDPERGRFLQRDPIGYRGEGGLHEYCGSAPVRHRDPKGTTPSTVPLFPPEFPTTPAPTPVSPPAPAPAPAPSGPSLAPGVGILKWLQRQLQVAFLLMVAQCPGCAPKAQPRGSIRRAPPRPGTEEVERYECKCMCRYGYRKLESWEPGHETIELPGGQTVPGRLPIPGGGGWGFGMFGPDEGPWYEMGDVFIGYKKDLFECVDDCKAFGKNAMGITKTIDKFNVAGEEDARKYYYFIGRCDGWRAR